MLSEDNNGYLGSAHTDQHTIPYNVMMVQSQPYYQSANNQPVVTYMDATAAQGPALSAAPMEMVPAHSYHSLLPGFTQPYPLANAPVFAYQQGLSVYPSQPHMFVNAPVSTNQYPSHVYPLQHHTHLNTPVLVNHASPAYAHHNRSPDTTAYQNNGVTPMNAKQIRSHEQDLHAQIKRLKHTIAIHEETVRVGQLVLEARDRDIAKSNKQVTALEKSAAESADTIARLKATITQRDVKIVQSDAVIQQMKSSVAEQDAIMANSRVILAERDAVIEQMKDEIKSLEAKAKEQSASIDYLVMMVAESNMNQMRQPEHQTEIRDSAMTTTDLAFTALDLNGDHNTSSHHTVGDRRTAASRNKKHGGFFNRKTANPHTDKPKVNEAKNGKASMTSSLRAHK